MLQISKYKAFTVGLLSVLILFAVAFAFDYRTKFDGLCMDCDNDFGWPFKVYQSGGLIHATKILWSGVIANLLTALISGVIVGAIVQAIWNRHTENDAKDMS